MTDPVLVEVRHTVLETRLYKVQVFDTPREAFDWAVEQEQAGTISVGNIRKTDGTWLFGNLADERTLAQAAEEARRA